MRLPKVIVPVLSSSSVSTSPAASTARPDFAMTLARTSRSMPAMPIAESSPPMVVGISVTNSATRKATGIVAPAKRAKGSSVTTTKRKISVKPTSRMLSAISFGVFCRSAPSTSAIIRSRKLLPGSAVILTTSQSETSRVPPVTAERSPPDSRITGANSPVMALSSTEATPATISPSAGMMSPASTKTMSPRRSCEDDTVSKASCGASAPGSFLQAVSALVARRLAACALPRPSATASAKFAKSTVSQSQTVICRIRPGRAEPEPNAVATRIMVVSSATTAVTKITGFRTRARGSSLRKAVARASVKSAAV